MLLPFGLPLLDVRDAHDDIAEDVGHHRGYVLHLVADEYADELERQLVEDRCCLAKGMAQLKRQTT